MNHRKSLAAFVATAAIASGLTGLAAPAASAQSLPGTITISNGTEWVGNDVRPENPPQGSWCSIGAVGNDAEGRKIGITAGHCWGLDVPFDQTNITDNSKPVFDRDNLNWREGGNERGNDPIGYLRWVKDPDGASGGHPGKDYSVIEFVDGVNLSSQGEYLKMTGIHELPSGTISSPYATAPAQPREKVLGTGVFTNHTLIHASHQTGVQYSRITSNQAAGIVGVYQSGASMQAGDSGGPAIIKDASAQLPSAANGYQTQGKWVGIVRGLIINYPIYSYTSSANILADLRTRDLASGQDGSVVGAGFQVTTNP